MNLTRYTLAKLINPRVYATFEKLTKDCDEEKLGVIINKTDSNIKAGKKPERALADALETYKLSGSVNA